MMQGGTTKLSEEIMYEIEKAGCIDMSKKEGSEINVFEFEFGSNAYNIWKLAFFKNAEEQKKKKNSDQLIVPIVVYGNRPPEYIHHVFTNAKNALLAYALLPKEAFLVDENNIIDIPFDDNNDRNLHPAGFMYNHNTLALYKVMERIRSGRSH